MESYQITATRELLSYIQKSPTAFQAVETTAKILEGAGFVRLSESEQYQPEPGGKYYVTRNLSSLIAFTLPQSTPKAFRVAASHPDSPTFALKHNAENEAGAYLKLNVERYGGMILSSWLDRPLSVAGRAIVKTEKGLSARSVVIDRDLCLIPNVAIHQNREINNGYKYNPAVDLAPLYGESKSGKGGILRATAEALGVEASDIAAADLYLYCRTPGVIFGEDDAFFSSPRIDNLMCAYGTLMGLLGANPKENDKSVSVYALLDNEETGSETKQGAGSFFLRDTLQRIADAFGTRLPEMLASSFMVSADNGHAKHPNHPELSDGQNSPTLNGGVVIKMNASQKYTTEALSKAIFEEICRRREIPVQYYANRSDLLGGSTLGSIANTNLPMTTVDIGLAQLSMHSSYETAGTADTSYLISAMEEFYSTEFKFLSDGNVEV